MRRLSSLFRSTGPLAIAPTTVKGRYINVPQTIQVDTVIDPISLVVLVEASSSPEAVLDKLRGSGILFSDLLAAYAGGTAIVWFSYDATVVRNFTADSSRVSHALKSLRVQGDSCAPLDGVLESLHLPATRDAGRRRIILVVAERRARSGRINFRIRRSIGSLTRRF